MKDIYQALASLSLFLWTMNNVISFATTRGEATVHDLKSAPEKWRIEVLEDHFSFSKEHEAELKRNVLEFFNQAGTPTYEKLNHYSTCLGIVFVLSACGYLRERHLTKKSKRAEEGANGNTP